MPCSIWLDSKEFGIKGTGFHLSLLGSKNKDSNTSFLNGKCVWLQAPESQFTEIELSWGL